MMKNVVRKLKHQPDNFVVRIYGHYNLNCKAVQQLKTDGDGDGDGAGYVVRVSAFGVRTARWSNTSFE